MGLLRNHLEMHAVSPIDQGEADADLVAQAREGSGAAFTILYRRHVLSVHRFCLYRLGSREDAEDATQVIFLRAAQSMEQCRSDDAFVGWLYAIARNVVTDIQRRRRTPTIHLVDELEIEDQSPLPEDQAMQSVQRDELREARSHCLNPADQDLFDLLMADLTYAEMARALNKRIGTVRTRYWRLLERLRICLERGSRRTGGAS